MPQSCVGNGYQALNPEQVTTAFLGATPYIASTILDLSMKRPNFAVDLPELVKLPAGEGNTIEQLVFRSSLPEIERGMEKWALQANTSGCEPCSGPDCSYHFTMFPGNAWERKRTALAERQFRTPAFCVKDVQSTKDYETVFAKIVETMFLQTAYFKEQNITFNALVSLAKKYVIDSNGPQANPENPYVYRNLQGVTTGTLNMTLLEFFYEYMSRMSGVKEFDMMDNAPVYALMASRQLISHMYRDDPSLRWDTRFSSAANALLSKYNFQSTIRNMFIPAPTQYPRRFILSAAGDPLEVLPLVSGIPAEVGTFTDLNPDYMLAPLEEVLICGMMPFSLAWKPTVSTLGQNTSFGVGGGTDGAGEPGFMDSWIWINPQTEQDPLRRVGYFMTSISLGLLPQHSEGIFGILVARPTVQQTVSYLPVPVAPPVQPVLDNFVDDVGCPCPTIMSVQADPFTANQYIFTLAAPLDVAVVATTVVKLGVNTGGYINATVVAIASDRKTFSATVPAGTVVDCNDQFRSLFCDDTLGCFSQIGSYSVNAADPTRYDLLLENPITADTAAQVVTLFFGNGSSASATVVSADMSQNLWVVDVGATDISDTIGGVIAICVPTATDANCPACGGALTTSAQCVP